MYLAVLLFIAPVVACETKLLDREALLVDFLILKHCQRAIVFDCGDVLPPRARVFRAAGSRNMAVQFVDLDRRYDVTTVFAPRQYAKLCAAVDFECPGAAALLEEVPQNVSRYRFLNQSVSWLLLPRTMAHISAESIVQRVLWNLTGIQLDTDLTIVEADPDGGVINLFDIYSQGRHLCKDIHRTLYGRWRTGEGIQQVPNYSRYRARGNFDRLQLRGVTVIDRDNITSDQVDTIFNEHGVQKGTTSFLKYHYALIMVLRDYHNFTIKFRVTRGWSGRLPSGYRLGLLGVVKRREADIAATGILMRMNRHEEYDAIHYSWIFESGFIYKITPDIGSQSEGNGFVAPFSLPVWIAFLVSLGLSVVVLRCLAQLSERWLVRQVETRGARSTMAYVLDVICCVAQQGVPGVPRLVPARIAVLVLLVANLVLFNYYTSTVVSGLLSAQMMGPETIPQLIDSPVKISFTDTGYHKVLFREQTLPHSKRLYERKARPPRTPQELPLYTNVDQAIPFLRRGGHALHCELSEVYPALAKQFTANEICEVRTVGGLYNSDIRLLALILPKHSMYSEMFRTTLMRAQETGIVKRINRIHKMPKPICQGSATVYSVELSEVSLAFIILGVGIALSGLMYLAESKRCGIRRRQRRTVVACRQPFATIPYLTDVIGMIAQQGTTQDSSRLPVRIVLYTVLIVNFILYNYYTASIAGELVSGFNREPQSIEQLRRSPLAVVFNNDSYNRALSKEESASPSNRSVAIYTDVATGVRLLHHDGFAFHCELTEAFRTIVQRFNAEEICELRTMEGLYTDLEMMSFVLPKRSQQFSEQFRLT
ncbi:uncharacterized protein LOC128270748 [Anopheles cruzii]|uniref:uncharacterized protein LOC128270748 n=1 Tax=Anopheles cruzii TaxID=68878 RepID=UPI0022EC85AC|nr:uncharacterized protein LOC128270748 [Anopheles cruzii]